MASTDSSFRDLVHSIDGIVWEANAETLAFTYVSPQTRDLLGYEPFEWYKSSTFWKDHIHPEDRQKAVTFCHKETLKGNNHRFEYRMKRSDGRYVWLRDLVTVVMEPGGQVKLRGVMLDITREKELEQEHDRVYEALEQRAIELQCLYAISNLEEQSISVQELLQEAARIIPSGFKHDEFVEVEIKCKGLTLRTGRFANRGKVLRSKHTVEGRPPFEITVCYPVKRKDLDFLEEEQRLLDSLARHLFLKVESIRWRERLVNSLNEKQTLLAEIHHRVKNNLAVVSGMMQLQADESKNEEVNSRLMDSVIRIKTMASIHERLYQSESLSRLNLSDHLGALIGEIVDTMGIDKSIHLNNKPSNLEIGLNQAIPCSLIVNEVVTNILKHAFKDLESGEISLEISSAGEESGEIELVIADNGVGLPADFDRVSKRSLGLNLIRVLTEQLHGSYRYESRDPGTRFILRFPRPDGSSHETVEP